MTSTETSDAGPPAPEAPEVPAAAEPVPHELAPARPWERIALAVLLLGTAAAYLWNITVNGMGNNFYAAATWSGSQDWKALLFGSLDPANFITVDKPPVSQWVMGLSGQIFGFSSASMLVPEALMAVAAVVLMYGALTRATGSRASGLLAGAALAVTPVVAMMFRFNNPDAVMVLLMTAGAYCTVRALRGASVRWLMLAGVALGFAFLAKMLEGLMVLPALGLAYLVVAPTTLGKRIAHLLAAAVALVVSAGWFVLLTILWPADSRPYLAGSKDNTFMDLVLGYNGISRYLGKNHMGGQKGGGPFELPPGYKLPENLLGGHGRGGGAFSGANGPDRMFTGEIGWEISWLLPAALVAFALVMVARGRSPRTDVVRGAALVFGLWLIIDGIAFTEMKGGMHAYYTLAVAPGIAGCVALGAFEAWRLRDGLIGRVGGAALVAASGGWAFVLLNRNADWQPWLRWTILALTVVVTLGLLLTAAPATARTPELRRRATTALLAASVIVGLAGTTAYAAATLPQAHTGGSPSVGPARPKQDDKANPFGGITRQQMAMFTGSGSVDPQLTAKLEATHTTWSAAIDRSGPAAGLELATNTAVLAIGGFTSEDPVPTLAGFQQLVHDHKIAYYLAQEVELPDSWKTDQPAPGAHHRKPGEPADPNAPKPDAPQPESAAPGTQANPDTPRWHPGGNPEIYNWVSAHYPVEHIGSTAVYDLTADPH
ncbi:glycosyltransferase family 39 protein [Nocardia stercoris]